MIMNNYNYVEPFTFSSIYMVSMHENGTYTIKGIYNGQFRIICNEDHCIHLISNRVTITSSDGFFLYITKADQVVITLLVENSFVDDDFLLENNTIEGENTSYLDSTSNFGEGFDDSLYLVTYC
ncbi:hypothetical protein PIROE2DRAFT_16939 [Piromyces sp. E2]|nr:hypothetical protein PIROE2DRAFT_16939 [Piromyces sp. E2]|eukprot:OUM57930.1 hypothetical protein PIROE2DRAFT_16939 [Piromyces sp. E2]